MDREAFVLANRLVGNPDGAAGLECTLIGAAHRVHRRAAGRGHRRRHGVDAQRRAGAALGGLPRQARATCSSSGPPRSGRARLPGDRAAASTRRPRWARARPTCAAGWAASRAARCARATGCRWARAGRARPRRRAGPGARARRTAAEPDRPRWCWDPQDDRFTAARHRGVPRRARTRCCPRATGWARGSRAPLIEHTRGHDIISDGVAARRDPGHRRRPAHRAAGRPAVHRRVHQDRTVCSFDIGRIGQVKPGQRLRFRRVTVAEAHAMLRQSRRSAGRGHRMDQDQGGTPP